MRPSSLRVDGLLPPSGRSPVNCPGAYVRPSLALFSLRWRSLLLLASDRLRPPSPYSCTLRWGSPTQYTLTLQCATPVRSSALCRRSPQRCKGALLGTALVLSLRCTCALVRAAPAPSSALLRHRRRARPPCASDFLRPTLAVSPALPRRSCLQCAGLSPALCQHSRFGYPGAFLRAAPLLSFLRHRHSALRCACALVWVAPALCFCSFPTVSFKMRRPPIPMSRRSPLPGSHPSCALRRQSPL